MKIFQDEAIINSLEVYFRNLLEGNSNWARLSFVVISQRLLPGKFSQSMVPTNTHTNMHIRGCTWVHTHIP